MYTYIYDIVIVLQNLCVIYSSYLSMMIIFPHRTIQSLVPTDILSLYHLCPISFAQRGKRGYDMVRRNNKPTTPQLAVIS
jgi:hypothetical protein